MRNDSKGACAANPGNAETFFVGRHHPPTSGRPGFLSPSNPGRSLSRRRDGVGKRGRAGARAPALRTLRRVNASVTPASPLAPTLAHVVEQQGGDSVATPKDV